MNEVPEKLNLVAYFEKMLFEPLVEFTKSISSDMPLETDWSSGNAGSWFLSPRQHTIEFLAYTIVYSLAAAYFYNRGFRYAKISVLSEDSSRTLGETLLLFGLILSFVLVSIHKLVTDNVIFLLQPCHVSLLLLIIVLVYPKSRRFPHVLFNVYLNIMWGTIMALLFPDYRSFTVFLEVENFHLEHWIILLSPLYIFYTRKVAVWRPSVSMTLAAYCFYGIYNGTILLPLSLIYGQNVNYHLTPPVQLLPIFGKYYRLGMNFVCLPVTFLMRWVFVSLAFKLTPRAKIAHLKNQ
ncbi:hypothetical protein K7432_011464 [Basidiobolus ranarum]|uniref:Transmembrane protein n=1 Tax=Basidiobolus ranarum TaxID=34480 RepID=A0ABR2VUT8_9FUNG